MSQLKWNNAMIEIKQTHQMQTRAIRITMGYVVRFPHVRWEIRKLYKYNANGVCIICKAGNVSSPKKCESSVYIGKTCMLFCQEMVIIL